MKIKKNICFPTKKEAHLVVNCRKHHRKKNSALPVMHWNKQFIASKLAKGLNFVSYNRIWKKKHEAHSVEKCSA